MSAPAVFGPLAEPCASCNAESGEPCAPWCIGAALVADELPARRRQLVRRGALVALMLAAVLVGATVDAWSPCAGAHACVVTVAP